MISRKFVSNTSKISLSKPNYFGFTKLKRLRRKTKFFLSFFLINTLNFFGIYFWQNEKTSTFASLGEMAEWSNAAVLKTVVPRGTGGSNPSLSALTGVAQLVEHWSPKPGVGRSSRSSRAKSGSFWDRIFVFISLLISFQLQH